MLENMIFQISKLINKFIIISLLELVGNVHCWI